MGEELRWGLSAFIALLIVGLFYFLWNLAYTPFRSEMGLKEKHTKEMNTIKEQKESLEKEMVILTSNMKPLANRNKLIESIAETKIAAIEYIELRESWKKGNTNPVFVDAINAGDREFKRYKEALEAMDKQIMVAGGDYEVRIRPLFLFIQASEAILNASPTENEDTIITFKFYLENWIRQTVESIDRLNQQASHKKGSQN